MMKAILVSRELEKRIISEYGTCRCHDLQVKFFGCFFNIIKPAEWEAAIKAGVPEKCSSLAGRVAGIAAALILEQQEKESRNTR